MCRCPMRKIRIPMSLLEESTSTKRVEEDRSIAIEAAIVRIMKVSQLQIMHHLHVCLFGLLLLFLNVCLFFNVYVYVYMLLLYSGRRD